MNTWSSLRAYVSQNGNSYYQVTADISELSHYHALTTCCDCHALPKYAPTRRFRFDYQLA